VLGCLKEKQQLYTGTSRMLYIRPLAALVSIYPPLRAQSACGSSGAALHDFAQGCAPRPRWRLRVKLRCNGTASAQGRRKRSSYAIRAGEKEA